MYLLVKKRVRVLSTCIGFLQRKKNYCVKWHYNKVCGINPLKSSGCLMIQCIYVLHTVFRTITCYFPVQKELVFIVKTVCVFAVQYKFNLEIQNFHLYSVKPLTVSDGAVLLGYHIFHVQNDTPKKRYVVLRNDCVSVQLSFLCFCKFERGGVAVVSVMKMWGTVLLIQTLCHISCSIMK